MTKVFIVEDEIDVLNSLSKRINESIDLKVIGKYRIADEALTDIQFKKPDVVIMDIGLPGLNGTAAMFRIKEKDPEIKVIMFTVFNNDDKVFEALKYGADGYVLKRDGAKGVINAIKEAVLDGAPMSRHIAKKVLKGYSLEKKSKVDLSVLTNREVEILELIAEGYTNKEIATRLSPQVSDGTVRQHIYRIYKKLQVKNRTEAAKKYRSHFD